MRKQLLLTGAVIVLTASCGALVQPSVRSASVECSTSRAYYITDLVIAIGTGIAASVVPDPKPVFYIPTAVFGASGLLGIYKRNNCVKWRDQAPPEEWARVAEQHRLDGEARTREQAEAEAQADAAQADAQAQAQPTCPDGYGYNPGSGLCESTAMGQAPMQPVIINQDASQTQVNSVHNTTVNSSSATNNNTTINSTTNVRPAADRSETNPSWYATYARKAGERPSCQAFDDGTAQVGNNMAACSRFCTPYMAAKLTCECQRTSCN